MERKKDIRNNSQNPLHVIIYEYFFNKYGLKKATEKKLKQVYFASYFYRNYSIKLCLFCQFIGIENPIGIIEFNYFLDWMKLLDEK